MTGSSALVAVDVTGDPVTIPAHPPLVSGALWVEARPDLDRLHVLAGDLLGALGKRRDIAGKGRNQQDDVRHAIAWVTAHDVEHLVVTEAQRLHPIILTGLMRLAAEIGARLWLLHRPPRSDAFVRALSRRGATTAELTEVPHPVAVPVLDPVPAADLPAVPADEFLTFRAACARTLPAGDAARADVHFLDTARRCDGALGDHGASRHTVADLLHRILNTAPGDAQLTVEVRALQAAAWHYDLYVKVDMARLLHSEERPRIPAADADAALVAYRQPHRAITVALTRDGHGLEDVGAVRIGDASPDGGTLTIVDGAVRVGPHTARAVRAQRHLRLAQGAGTDELLLPHTPKALAKALTEAASDLGIHVFGRRAERTRDHTEGALRALGVTVEALP
ncbi:hypothetical protein [Blastococcus sp. KM273128]|uniref:hypothetical protein n=1 Tax=Blastococcus sp. KM273128 TaxID=2570314 RepID=UPI001F1E6C1E|nr:hypothetical protein [Blastococcus sp. KM273128]